MAEATSESPDIQKESFAALLDESLGHADSLEGTVLKGTVVAIDGDAAVTQCFFDDRSCLTLGLEFHGVALGEAGDAPARPCPASRPGSERKEVDTP